MEGNTSSSQEATSKTSKKGPLENLSNEELIKKCKGLLTIAQKAKQAKDEYAEENKKLKEELNKYENQKEADKKALIAMKEIVDNLTENKLSLTTEISDLKTWKLNIQKEIDEKESKLIELQIENESLNRQVKRLIDENENLLTNLDDMEKKFDQVNKFSIQQQKDLVALENETIKWKEYESKCVNIQIKFDEIFKENEELKLKLDSLEKEKYENEMKNTNENEESIKNFEKQIEQLKNNEKEQNEKIQIIKQKLMSVAMKLKKLKSSKEILLETVQDYSESISNWQRDINNVSNQLCNRIVNLENDKIVLEEEKKMFKSLEENLLSEKNVLEKQLMILNVEKQNLEKIIEHLKTSNENVPENYQIKLFEMIELCEKALNEFDMEKTKINDTTSQNLAKIIELENENQMKQEILNNQNKQIQELKQKLEENRLEIEKLKSDLLQNSNENDKNKKFEEIEKTLTQKNDDIIMLTTEKEKLLKEIENLQQNLNEIHIKFEEKQKENKDNCKKLQILQENYNLQSSELEKFKNTIQNSDEIIKLQEKLISNEKCINNLKDENIKLSSTITNQLNDLEHLKTLLKLHETENSDLLSEMRELNEALKTRGDVISRQQEKIQELELELKQTLEKLHNIEKNLTEKENQIIEKRI